ncbi:hypothetical protein [Streptomyces sp. GESEQ-35]|uniref:hypothetical protein n=1 Tax=Streptomyces sp. GESEQ-35 TaxID=2812657 RepID=UPI001B33602B|nr:hypothetical protein [Streptomyces sp. GESEQ-35]
MAAVAAAVALPLMVASPAHAELVDCNYNSTPNGWYGSCHRFPTDGDAGGVSGDVQNTHVSSDRSARVEFKARSERYWFSNRTNRKASFTSWIVVGGQWRMFKEAQLNTNGDFWFNTSIAENIPVSISICVEGKGCVRVDSLRS